MSGQQRCARQRGCLAAGLLLLAAGCGGSSGLLVTDRITLQGSVPPEFAVITSASDEEPAPRMRLRASSAERVETVDGRAVGPPPDHGFVWVEATVTNHRDRPLDWAAAAIATLGEAGECVEVRWLPASSDRLLPVTDVTTPWGPFDAGRIPPGEVGTGHLLFACRDGADLRSRPLRLFYGYAQEGGAVEVWHPADLSVVPTRTEASPQ